MVIESAPTMTNRPGLVERGVSGWRHGPFRSSDDPRGVAPRPTAVSSSSRPVTSLAEPGAWKVLAHAAYRSSGDHSLRTHGVGDRPSAQARAHRHQHQGDFARRSGATRCSTRMIRTSLSCSRCWRTSRPRSRATSRACAPTAGFLAHLAQHEGLPPFARDAVVALTEQGARICSPAQPAHDTVRTSGPTSPGKRRSWRDRHGSRTVTGSPCPGRDKGGVQHRIDLPARHFRKLVAEGTLPIHTRGAEVGQVNGLAVSHAGPLTYGFPTRITATIGPGTAGTINIEREAQASLAPSTRKAFTFWAACCASSSARPTLWPSRPPLPLSKAMGVLMATPRPAPRCVVWLSALTDVPLRQDLAMTGAIDQVGHVRPVGAVTEKIEGFFDTCQDSA